MSFTDGSVVRSVTSGWAFTARENNHTVMERSGASDITTFSMSMEVRAISETFSWLQDTVYESAIILTDSMSTLEKIRKACLHAEWKRAIESKINSAGKVQNRWVGLTDDEWDKELSIIEELTADEFLDFIRADFGVSKMVKLATHHPKMIVRQLFNMVKGT